VTNVAIVSVNTRIRRCGFSIPRIRLIIKLAEISTNAVAAAMVSAGFIAPVTASTGHIPSSCRYTGFSGMIPFRNRSVAVGEDGAIS
jgi:hypothetical protein